MIQTFKLEYYIIRVNVSLSLGILTLNPGKFTTKNGKIFNLVQILKNAKFI